MRTILVTGFGPFPGVPLNPSGAMLRLLPEVIEGATLVLQTLPTEYCAAGPLIEQLIATVRPDICLCTGVGSRREFRLERVARNHGSICDPDESGRAWSGPIAPEGPDTYPSGLPLDRMRTALARRGHAASLSEDAGGYLCNFVFYRASHVIAEEGLAARCGFLHLPTGETDEKALRAMADAVALCVETVLAEAQTADVDIV